MSTAATHLYTPDPGASDATISLWAGLQAGSLARACDAIQDGADMGAHNRFGANPMILAIYSAGNSLDLIDLLLESGAPWWMPTEGTARLTTPRSSWTAEPCTPAWRSGTPRSSPEKKPSP